MKLKPLNIFGKEVTVQLADLKSQGLYGQYNYETKEILIEKDCPDKFSTYIHEALHSVWHRMGMTQSGVTNDLHELIVENFSRAIEENFKEICHAHKLFSEERKKLSKKSTKE